MSFSNYVAKPSNYYQIKIYPKLAEFSASHPYSGRIILLAASILDGALEIITRPLEAIQSLAFAILNLVGALFSSQCTMANSWHYTKFMVERSIFTLVQPVASMIALFVQIAVILKNPREAETQTLVWESFVQSSKIFSTDIHLAE